MVNGAKAVVVKATFVNPLPKVTVPAYAAVPTVGAVVVMLPPMVNVLPVATAIVPPKALMEMALEMVAVVLANNKPVAAMVTVPDERWVPLEPPEATDNMPAPMVVPPV